MAKRRAPPPVTNEKSADGDKADYWLKQIASASRKESEWRELGKKIVNKYRNEERSKSNDKSAYNILFANIEVLQGVLYNKPPTPEVRRRFRDKDPVGRVAAEVLDRSLTYNIDAYDFDGITKEVIFDRLCVGRGNAYVKYIPTFAPQDPAQISTQSAGSADDPDLTPARDVIYEEVRCEYIDWSLFRVSPNAKRWHDVKWVAFGDVLEKSDLKQRFPKNWSQVSLNYEEGSERGADPDDPFPDDSNAKTNRALVWMIWSKVDRKVYWVSPGYKEGLLGVKDDPLGLEGFFPCPKPLYGIQTTSSLVPIPDYIQYQDQAEELNRISERIVVLIDSLRRHGLYDSVFDELAKITKAPDNTFIAVENYSALIDKGGVQNILYEMPIEGIAKVVQSLYTERDQAIQAIYQITGISDLIRGQTNPNETLGAQQLKSNYSNSRIGPQQQEIQRWCRDILRLKAEVMAGHFSPKTFQQITGIELPTAQEKQMQMMAAQQQGQPPPANDEPTWDDVMKLLRDEKLRGTRIDIETDSTLNLNDAADKQAVAEMINSVGLTIQSLAPAFQAGMISKETADAILMDFVRRTQLGYRIEESIENSPPPPPQQDPAAAEQAKMQAKVQGDAQIAQLQGQQTAQIEQLKGQQQLALQKMNNDHAIALEQEKTQRDLAMEKMRHGNKLDIEFLKGTMDGKASDGSVSTLPDAMSQITQALQGIVQEQGRQAKQIGILGQAVQTVVARLTAPKRFIYDQNGQIVGREVVGFGTEPIQRDASGKIIGSGSVQ